MTPVLAFGSGYTITTLGRLFRRTLKRTNIESVARWMREVALQKDGYSILTNKDLAEHHEQLIKIYYHAGRYAGGARDKTAEMAYRTFERTTNANYSRNA